MRPARTSARQAGWSRVQWVDKSGIGVRDLEEEVPVLGLGLAQGGLGLEVDGLAALVGLVLDGADVHAGAAAGAVLGGDLEGGLHAGELLALGVDAT